MTDIMHANMAYASALNPVLTAPHVGKDLAQAEKAAEDFEAFFLSRTMESMFEGVSTDGIFGGGHAEKIYRSMLLDAYGKEMAKLGTLGVKQDIMRAVLQMQEAATAEKGLNG